MSNIFGGWWLSFRHFGFKENFPWDMLVLNSKQATFCSKTLFRHFGLKESPFGSPDIWFWSKTGPQTFWFQSKAFVHVQIFGLTCTAIFFFDKYAYLVHSKTLIQTLFKFGFEEKIFLRHFWFAKQDICWDILLLDQDFSELSMKTFRARLL